MNAGYLPDTIPVTAFVLLGDPWGLLMLWLAGINIVTFLVFGWDKFKAKRGSTHKTVRRIPEKRLFLLAGLGGSAGALLGMKVWRHKTLHRTFRFGIPVILLVQMLLILGLWLYGTAIY